MAHHPNSAMRIGHQHFSLNLLFHRRFPPTKPILPIKFTFSVNSPDFSKNV